MAVYENLTGIETNRSVIPSTCLTFAEQSLFVAEHAEVCFNAMMESVGVEELAVYESTGLEIVYEGAKLDAFKEKAMKLFKDIWAAIKGAYEKVLKWFEDKRVESVKELTQLSAGDVDLVSDDAKLGKTHKFDKLDNSGFLGRASELLSKIEGDFKALATKEADDINDQIASKKEEYEGTIIKKVSGLEAKDMNALRKALKDELEGEEVEVTKAWIKSNLSELQGIVLKGDMKRYIKESYNREKKEIDDVIKYFKGLKEGENQVKAANAAIVVLKNLVTCFHTCNAVRMDACRRRYVESKAILIKVHGTVLKAKKAEKKTAANESTVISSQVDLVNEAFNW